ncbi:MAG TPA: lysylphosphatidylglycerol synthase transmembrane domain-containing protein [Chloroflexia bacterium]|nr:lysylphosphatidylglycerol synthase transmembrane domain-containing protein [Chloroflexia bacterium]
MGLFNNGKWKFWFGLVVGLFFLALAFKDQNFSEIGRSLSQANYWWLIPGLAVYFLGVFIRAIRWHYLLGPMQPVSSRRLFPVVVIGYMANNVLPVRMGEVVRAYVLDRRDGVRKTTALATIVVERIMDGITMILFLSAASLFVKINSGIGGIEKAASIVFLVGIAIFFLVAHSRTWMKRFETIGLRFVPAPVRPKVAGLADSFIDGLQVLRQWRDLLIVFALSVVAWVCEGGMYWMVAMAFSNLNLSLAAVFMTLAVANLATLVPSTPGYVGPFDAAAKLVLVEVFAISQNLASSYVILLHAALYLPITLFGLYYWVREHFSFKEAEQLRSTSVEEKKALKRANDLPGGFNLEVQASPVPVKGGSNRD